MAGFSNPVLGGGGALVRDSIHSPNYVPGVSGWSINKDGTSDFTGGVAAPSFSDLTAGTIGTVGTLGPGGALESGAGGARFVIDATGINLFDAGGSNTVKLDSATGSATFSGTITASTITGSTITGGLFQTATSGDRLTISSGAANQIDFYSAAGDHGWLKAGTAASNLIQLYSAGGSFLALDNTTATLYSTSGTGLASNGGNITCGGVAVGMSAFGTGSLSIQGNTTTIEGNPTTINVGTGGTVTVGGDTTFTTDTHHTGQVYAAGVYNFTGAASNAVNVETGANHRLYRVVSSRRYKREIRPADPTPFAGVLDLQPVTYVDAGQWDANGGSDEGLTRYLGLIAEDVAEVPGVGEWLVPRDEDGQPSSVTYSHLGVMLLPIVRQLVDQVADLQHRLAVLEAHH